MITDIEQKNTRNELQNETLPDYWQGYFRYRDSADELYQLAGARLRDVIEMAKDMTRPFIDSQQAIGHILTEFGNQHNFHRQFREQLPELHPNQTLGMHLYDLILHDGETWVYIETQHAGHLFPHATYFIRRD